MNNFSKIEYYASVTELNRIRNSQLVCESRENSDTSQQDAREMLWPDFTESEKNPLTRPCFCFWYNFFLLFVCATELLDRTQRHKITRRSLWLYFILWTLNCVEEKNIIKISLSGVGLPKNERNNEFLYFYEINKAQNVLKWKSPTGSMFNVKLKFYFQPFNV